MATSTSAARRSGRIERARYSPTQVVTTSAEASSKVCILACDQAVDRNIHAARHAKAVAGVGRERNGPNRRPSNTNAGNWTMRYVIRIAVAGVSRSNPV